jgi:hypothetical protein
LVKFTPAGARADGHTGNVDFYRDKINALKAAGLRRSPDNGGLQITDAGLSLARWLEGSSADSLELPSTPTPPPLRMIDDLIGQPGTTRDLRS